MIDPQFDAPADGGLHAALQTLPASTAIGDQSSIPAGESLLIAQIADAAGLVTTCSPRVDDMCRERAARLSLWPPAASRTPARSPPARRPQGLPGAHEPQRRFAGPDPE